MLSPCKDCVKRTIICHIYCEEYKVFRAKCDAVIKARQKDNLTFNDKLKKYEK